MEASQRRRKVRPGARLHPIVSDLCILQDAVYIAGEVVFDLPITPPFQKHSFSLACVRRPIEVIIPILGPFYTAALNDPRPVTYEIALMDYKEPDPIPDSQRLYTPKLKTATTMIFSSLFVIFYERHRPWMQDRFGREVKEWPDLFRFCWAVRNACVHHDGRINFTNPNFPAVSWAGLTFGPADSGTVLLHKDRFAVGDMFVLLMELSDALDGFGAPI